MYIRHSFYMDIQIKSKRILVTALNWGLGHATRCIPIINELKKNNEVAIASDGYALEILKMAFPELSYYELPAYNIHYRYQSMVLNMAVQAPKFWTIYRKEKRETQSIIRDFGANVVISDNRFGVIGKDTYNIFMTHQLNIPMGNIFLGKIANEIHHFFINQYDECWVPDSQENPLAGKMSQAHSPIPKKYIGILSRLEPKQVEKDIDIIAVLSGPEPQRTKLEDSLLRHIDSKNNKVVLVRGSNENFIHHHNIEIHNFLGSERLNALMNRSKMVICRSGYTSLMDLRKLNQKAILIPTPGQYEQEYLADQLDGKYGFITLKQSDITQDSLGRKISNCR